MKILENKPERGFGPKPENGILNLEFRWLGNSSRTSIRILFGNTVDCGILKEFFNNFDQNTGRTLYLVANIKYIRWFWNSLSISIRILFWNAATCFDQNSLNSSLKKIFEELCSHLFSPTGKDVIRILQKLRWQRNSYEILHEFWSEYWWKTLEANTSELGCHLFLPIGKVDKFQKTSEFFKKLDDSGIVL